MTYQADLHLHTTLVSNHRNCIEKIEKSEIVAMYTRRLMVLKCKDKKNVLMLNAFHNDYTKEIEDQNTRK